MGDGVPRRPQPKHPQHQQPSSVTTMRWEIWRTSTGVFWLEKPMGRQEIKDLQWRVAAVTSTRAQAEKTMKPLKGDGK